MNELLLRQRRNLIIAGIIILLLSLGDVEIQKISLLGIEFDFKTNIGLLYSAVWIVWFYFLYRYFVYFLQEGMPILNEIFLKTNEEIINPHIKKTIYKKYDNLNDGCGYSYGNIKRNNMVFLGQAYKKVTESVTGHEIDKLYDFEYNFRSFDLYVWQFKAFLVFFFFKSAVTDYILPFAFSLFVLITATIAKWPGNLITILT